MIHSILLRSLFCKDFIEIILYKNLKFIVETLKLNLSVAQRVSTRNDLAENETSFKNEALKIKNEAFLRDFLQK